MLATECEVCGEPATTFVRDYAETEASREGTAPRRTFKAVGAVHCFCQKHERDAKCVEGASGSRTPDLLQQRERGDNARRLDNPRDADRG